MKISPTLYSISVCILGIHGLVATARNHMKESLLKSYRKLFSFAESDYFTTVAICYCLQRMQELILQVITLRVFIAYVTCLPMHHVSNI